MLFIRLCANFTQTVILKKNIQTCFPKQTKTRYDDNKQENVSPKAFTRQQMSCSLAQSFP